MDITAISIQEKLNRQAKRNTILAAVLPFMGLIFITGLLIAVTNGKLIRASNIELILNQCFTVSIVGVGATFVYAHGGMDFSIGAACGLAQYVCLTCLTKFGLPIYLAILASILVGLTASTLVGTIAVLLRVPVFITSLCVRSICAGLLAYAVNNVKGGQITLNFATYSRFNNEFLKLGILIAFVAVGYFLFEKTFFGKFQKAMGGNLITAFQAGVETIKNRILAYSLLGLCVGVAAFFLLTRMGLVSGTSGSGLEFDIMVALVLGGFPMAGGSTAKLRAVIIGALTMTILSNGLILWGLDVNIVNGVKGLLFIAIVALSYNRSNLNQVNLLVS